MTIMKPLLCQISNRITQQSARLGPAQAGTCPPVNRFRIPRDSKSQSWGAKPARPSRKLRTTKAHVRDREVVVRAGEPGIEAQRGFESPRCLVELPHLHVRVAEVEVLEGDFPLAGIGCASPDRERGGKRRGERTGGGDTYGPKPPHGAIIERTAARHNGRPRDHRAPRNIDEHRGRRYAYRE